MRSIETREVIAVNHHNAEIEQLTRKPVTNFTEISNVDLEKALPDGSQKLTFDSPPCVMHSRVRGAAV